MTQRPEELAPGVFMVGGPDLTDSRDCLCYLVAGKSARVLIDCGSGPSAARILELAQRAAGAPPTHLFLTHAHIDHAGGAAAIKRMAGCQVLAHRLERRVLASGDAEKSAAVWYGLPLEPLEPDVVITDEMGIEMGGGDSLHLVHTPGHTPGSMAAWRVCGDKKVLFGQDIHGPFNAAFGSDLGKWRQSMERLISLGADILAEGHYGVYQPAEEVEGFIRSMLESN